MTHEKSLLSSAQQFLIEALENHNHGKHDFAIVHAVTAAELLLKERLTRIHPGLIFRNVDAPTFQAEQTISLESCGSASAISVSRSKHKMPSWLDNS
jgi:hypothetical protein